MASTLKHLRSSTADKRPTASGLVDGQLAINTASGTPALFFKDNNGGVVKVGPAHVGSAAPNAVPAGSAGNSLGELWVDNGLTTPGLNYYTGSAFVNLTPSGTTTTVGLVELATPAETQTGTDAVRAVTPSGLQSKVSDSTSTTSSTTIASSTAVKSAYDLANAALPKAGGTVTGELLIGNTGSLVFEGSSDDSFETTIAVVDPTGDRTITFPNVTGTVVTTGDSGTVTSTMIANDTIVNADINSAAAIVDTKLATISTADKVSISALNIDGATDIGGALENGDLFIVDDGAGGTNRKAPAFRMSQLVYSGVTGDITIASGGTSAIGAGVIVNADVNASAAIAGTKISPDFGSQTITTTGVVSAALGAAATPSITFTGDLNTGIYSPGADQVAISTNGTNRFQIDSSGNITVDTNTFYVDAANNRVGVGTSAPGELLDVAGNIRQTGNTAGTANTVGLIDFYNANNTTTIARVNVRTDGAANSGSYRISTANAGTLNEVVRITSTGTVNFTGAGTAGSTQAVSFNGSAPVNSLVIDSSGRVGIGTSSPGSLLTSYPGNVSTLGAKASTGLLIDNNGSAGNISQIGLGYTFSGTYHPVAIAAITDSGSGSTRADLHFATRSLTTDSAPDTRMIIKSDGKVGIGITSPGAPLDVVGSADTFVLSSNATNSTTKEAKIQCRHYTNAEENLMLLYGFSTSTDNAVVLGGGSGNQNAATTVRFFTAADTTTTSGSERARIDSSGRLLVGTSSSRQVNASIAALQFQIEGTTYQSSSMSLVTNQNVADGSYIILGKSRGTTLNSSTIVNSGDSLGALWFCGADGNTMPRGAIIEAQVDGTPGASDMPGRLVFSTTADGASSPTERMRINNVGDVTFSTNIAAIATASSSGDLGNAAARILGVSRNTTTSRSINANGTINASGTDYAEYMTKAGDFTLAKGGICGVTADGLLTLNYSDAVSFVVKSTNPSYVGGDTWGAGFDDDPEGLELARQTVDRIAFAGQVPVNVMGATPGQYIVPSATEDGGIIGIAKGEAELTLAEYMQAVGKVIAIEDDGHARIIVKVA